MSYLVLPRHTAWVASIALTLVLFLCMPSAFAQPAKSDGANALVPTKWKVVEGPTDSLQATDASSSDYRLSVDRGTVILAAELSGDFLITLALPDAAALPEGLSVGLGTVRDFSIGSGIHREGKRPVAYRLMRSGGILGRQYSYNGIDWDYDQNSSDWAVLPDTIRVTVNFTVEKPVADLPVRLTVVDPGAMNPRSSWVGNTYPDRARAVPSTIGAIHATPDGAVHTNGHFNESTWSQKIYGADGAYIGRHAIGGAGSRGGWAIVGDESHLYFVDNSRRCIFRSQHDGSHGGLSRELPQGSLIVGMAIHDNHLYASDLMGNRVLRFKLPGLEPDGDLLVNTPGQIAIDARGMIWIVHNEHTHVARMAESRLKRELGHFPQPVVIGYALEGDALVEKLRLEGLADPMAIHYHATTDTLLVADNGPDYNIKIFGNLDKPPTVIGSIGQLNGIYAKPAGEIRPGHLNGVQAITSAGADVIYVVNAGKRPEFGSWHGSDLRRFERETTTGRWQERWSLVGLHFVDFGVVDPQSEDVFSRTEHYQMDHDAHNGENWSYHAFTHDPFAFPHDPRLWERMYRVYKVVQRDGHKLLFLGSDQAPFLVVYRFDSESNGYTAIPAALITTQALRAGKWGHPAPQPVEVDSKRSWYWIDANGDGQMDAEEQHLLENGSTRMEWSVASNGDIYQPGDDGFVVHRLDGFDDHGVPKYTFAAENIPYPDPIISFWRNTGNRVEYDAKRDVAFVGGNTQERRGFQGMFPREVARFDHWSDPARRRLVSRTILPHDNDRWPGPGERTRNLGGWDYAGDYLFVGSLKPSVFRVYDTRTGSLIDAFSPGPELGGEMGDMDRGAIGVRVHKRADDQYIIVAEEDFFLKLAVFYWTPPTQTAPAQHLATPTLQTHPTSKGTRIDWNIEGLAVIDGYLVERRNGNQQVARLTPKPVLASTFFDEQPRSTEQREYRVIPVSNGEKGSPSPWRPGSYSPPRAEFNGEDHTTLGNWQGRYGKEGHYLFPDGQMPLTLGNGSFAGAQLPQAVRIFPAQHISQTHNFGDALDDAMLLALPNRVDRARQKWAWRSNNGTVHVQVLDGTPRLFSLYILPNRDPTPVQVTLIDPGTRKTLDQQSITIRERGYGVYLTWEINGHVEVHISSPGGDPRIPGFFIDPINNDE